jgi:hypothetical protein
MSTPPVTPAAPVAPASPGAPASASAVAEHVSLEALRTLRDKYRSGAAEITTQIEQLTAKLETLRANRTATLGGAAVLDRIIEDHAARDIALA